jgi:hypothetical protein
MAKKVNIADFSGETRDKGTVRYYCYQMKYSFPLPKLDDDGKPVMKTDANGNNATKVYETFTFQSLPVIDPETRKPKMNDPRSFFDVLPTDPNRERLIAYLDKCVIDKQTKIVDEETYFKEENPEAYRIAVVKKEIEDKHAAKIKELEDRLAKAESKK